jgi:hypothetical protein
MRDVFRLATAMLSVLALTGCAARMTVSSHVEPGLDWSRYRTFDWGPADALPTGDVRLVENPRFNDHMQGTVEKGLQAVGLVLTSTESPDLLIHYHANITRRIDVNHVYDVGTLLIDLVDAHSDRLVWRGWAKGSIDGIVDDQKWMEHRIDAAVARIMRELPRNR